MSIVYVGTLHPSHFTETKSAIEAGKHVLVEKPAVLNAAEWEYLIKLAKSRNVFLMEGMCVFSIRADDSDVDGFHASSWGFAEIAA